ARTVDCSWRARAGGKKEPNAASNVRPDLCIEHLEVHFEQCSQQDWHNDEIEEEPRRRSQVLRREHPQPAEFAGLRHVAQEAGPELGAELTRGSADAAGQIREA